MMRRIVFPCFQLVGLSVAMLALAGCGGLGLGATPSPTPTSTPIPPTDTPTPSPTPIPRSAVIKSVSGTVDLRVGAQGQFATATAGETMQVGDELRTGKDGRAMVMLDDGTGLVLTADSNFDLKALEGTHETPITQFFLNLGQLFTVGHGDLPSGATYEIDTPKGVATIRGSMLGVSYSKTKGTQVTCLIGHCAATLGTQSVDLLGGKQVTITNAGLSKPTDMDSNQKLAWTQVIHTAEAAGVKTSESISSTCSCSGQDMKCSDGTTVSSFPTCKEGASCTCSSAGDLTCGSTTTAKSPVCGQNASGCVCNGPNLICDNNQTFYNVPSCTGGSTCLCQGADLTCSDGTTYPSDPSCAPRTGCTCTQGYQVCPDGSMSFNSPSCSNPDIPCTCQGTTFVCNPNGQSISIPNYPLCGGSAGAGGTRTCVCANGMTYCSDGSVSPGC